MAPTIVAPPYPSPAPPVTPPPAARPPATPPPASAAPPAARYPLFADAEPTVIRPVDRPPPPLHQQPVPGGASGGGDRGGRTWLAWVAALVAVALIAGLGAVLLLGGGDDTADDPSSVDAPGRGDAQDDDNDDTDDPDGADDAGPAAAPDPDDVLDVTSNVRASVPAVGAPSADLAGQPVTFVAANMWDGDPATAWRMPGSGAGETVVLELGQDTVITEVGLINGYAKTDQGTNWYRGNRRIQEVVWEFDDGTRVTQDLRDQRELQTIAIDPIRTGTVRLHLARVSKPGGGPARRDNTAISEVRLLGAPVD
ncbi:discoidin domain-containing protein [Nocardioides caeni]|uniref:Discoidin domain-containing protein n=1 Tax=Nocardioides caeni TaxID=574700 RepID=A0A4S8NNW0_9ACTN|nr:discoidin domain-containing protein [Nocardioides caeni]THV18528.1 discoidin domain-containing protein [Nocardioides caeni]